MHFAARPATNAGLAARVFFHNDLSGAFTLLRDFAFPMPHGVNHLARLLHQGCSFDLGSWGSDSEKPKQVAQKPTEDISARSVTDAQGYNVSAQVLAKSGKNEQALAEFGRALALDPYNARSLSLSLLLQHHRGTA